MVAPIPNIPHDNRVPATRNTIPSTYATPSRTTTRWIEDTTSISQSHNSVGTAASLRYDHTKIVLREKTMLF